MKYEITMNDNPRFYRNDPWINYATAREIAKHIQYSIADGEIEDLSLDNVLKEYGFDISNHSDLKGKKLSEKQIDKIRIEFDCDTGPTTLIIPVEEK